MLCDPIRRPIDHLVVLARLAFEADHVQGVLVHLLNDKLHCPNAPNVVDVPDVDLRVNFEFADLTLLETLLVGFSPRLPVALNRLVRAVFDELVDDVVYFKAHAAGSVPHHLALSAEEVAHKAGLNINCKQTC